MTHLNWSRLLIQEARYRWLGTLLGICSVALAVGCLIGAITLIDAHDQRTNQILAQRQLELTTRIKTLDDEIRKSMLKLGFNVVILPEEQPLSEWYANGAGSQTMPETHVTTLAEASIVTVQHLLPIVQQKVFWPEHKQPVLLVGTHGEVPIMHKDPKKPLLAAVPAGGAVLGYQLHKTLQLNVGDTITFMGQKLHVHKLHPERGTVDDITLWMDLGEAQALLGLEGRIHAIQALECKCAWADLAKVRAEIAGVLPGTQVIEIAGEALARAEARQKVAADGQAMLEEERVAREALRSEREQLATWVVGLVVVTAAIWIALLMVTNVRERHGEIAILAAMGCLPGPILRLFLAKAALIGLVGGIIGVGLGWLVGSRLSTTIDGATPTALTPSHALLGVAVALIICVLASWIPALQASLQQPANTLQHE